MYRLNTRSNLHGDLCADTLITAPGQLIFHFLGSCVIYILITKM